ncbi:Mur ligase family protein [Caldisalinibacter kiritimatiensis]|uniref:UDP-N-acetylmuramoylalanyl-D-glutamate--2,6-diaminopimelate ligase n=1 Tax=Caldisalinibacter kiritimatiensis TaxID=1304284 RepID=R1AQW3_9FIRM|nr:Mur ligase family protein [Caldisalinibacter kiritimatiensis]EOC99507.1 UDP-N-acetylmuramoylalanyl-D-glutamate--2,6- diaminopimelate ligase [Caldisalinibacter kiritimatiensis]
MKIDGIEILGITCNSKKVREGYVFVAIEGENKDGNDYIDEAIDRGAVLIYTEKDVKNKKVPVKKVEHARKKLSELLNEFYDFPSEKMRLIGVTGTNGKTTTTHLIYKIFKKAGYKTGLIGTIGTKIDEEYIPPTLTTPEPEVLFDILNNMLEQGIEVVVMEVSSHGLKFCRTSGLKFDIAVHTNIEKDHMNLHHTFDDYIKTKKKLFDNLENNKIAVLNVDDEYAVKLVQDNTRPLILTYGLNNKATVTASSLEIGNTISFTVCLQRGLTTIRSNTVEPLEFKAILHLLGKHNIYNALAAISVALIFEIDIDVIIQALKEFKGVHRRLEKIYEGKYLVIDDFCHNPSSYEAVFESIQGMEYNKLILVNAIRGNRGTEINKDNAKVLSTWFSILGVNKLILTLSNDVVKDKDEVKEDEFLAYRDELKNNNIEFQVYNTLKEAIKAALNIVRENDIIMLLGAQGMDQGREILYNEIVQ